MSIDLELLAKLRDIGVQSFEGISGDAYRVSFFPQEPKREGGAIVPRSMTQDAPHQEDVCACGHSIPSHDQAGNCYLGCELPKCMASVAK